MKKLLLIFLISLFSLGIFAQIGIYATPDTVPNFGSRKELRDNSNWNVLRNVIDRDSIAINSTAIDLNTAKTTNATHSGEVTGATALTIADNVIEEANLEVTNAPTDNYILSYDDGTAGFTWIVDGGGGDMSYSDTAAMLAPYVVYGDTTAMLAPYVVYGDTANMLAPYLVYGDTAAMLLPYVSVSDTTGMLAPYVVYGDTAAMLEPYSNALIDSTWTSIMVDTIAEQSSTHGVLIDEVLINNASITSTSSGQKIIGSSILPWDQMTSDLYFVEDNTTYISESSGDMSFTSNDAGTVLLAYLAAGGEASDSSWASIDVDSISMPGLDLYSNATNAIIRPTTGNGLWLPIPSGEYLAIGPNTWASTFVVIDDNNTSGFTNTFAVTNETGEAFAVQTAGPIYMSQLGDDDAEDHLIAIDDGTGLLTKRAVSSMGDMSYSDTAAMLAPYQSQIDALGVLIIDLQSQLDALTTTPSDTNLFYVSNVGNDSYPGTSIDSAWLTISKVNGETFDPNDQILFKKGDTWNETLTVPSSGDADNSITFGAYGTGANPIISGFETISGWTDEGGGIYSKVISQVSTPNMVTLDDVNTPMGRYPNTGYLDIDSHVTNTTITDADLDAAVVDWTDAEVVIRKTRWVIDRGPITDHTSHTLTYTSPTSRDAIDDFGYFIQNDIQCLTDLGDWYCDVDTFYMYFGAVDPTTKVVNVAVIDTLVNIDTDNYITFDGIDFEGANEMVFSHDDASYVTIQNCAIDYSGYNVVDIAGTMSNLSLINCDINETQNDVIISGGSGTDLYVGYCTIANTGTIAGMGGSGDGKYIAIYHRGDNSIIEYNSITNSGYMSIDFGGDSSIVRNNFIDTFCDVKDDGAGIYTYTGEVPVVWVERYITDNIVINGIGNIEGTTSTEAVASGIYLDNLSSNITATGNTISDCNFGGFMINWGTDLTITDNIINDCVRGLTASSGSTLKLEDIIFEDNILSNQSSVLVNSNQGEDVDIDNTFIWISTLETYYDIGSLDNNYYLSPTNGKAFAWQYRGTEIVDLYNLADWKTLTSDEAGSERSRKSDTLIYNNTTASTNNAVSNLTDVDGTLYATNVTLLPFEGIELLAPPKVVSAEVLHQSPDEMLITMDGPMDETSVPATTAFALENKTITAVDVTGEFVTLTVSADYAYGDTDSVSYTVPGSNPLLAEIDGISVATFSDTVVSNGIVEVPTDVIEDGSTVAWYIADDLTTITKNGSEEVSDWEDKLGSGHDLEQSTATEYPIWSADGILFDGTNDFMKATGWTYEQPHHIYMVYEYLSYNSSDRIFDGNTSGSVLLRKGASNTVAASAGTTSAAVNDLVLRETGIVRILFQDALSELTINEETTEIWTSGTNDLDGFNLGCRSQNEDYNSNILVKEIILRDVSDSPADEATIYNYLKGKYDLEF